MRNALPARSRFKECAIVNLDDKNKSGTHWTAYVKNGKEIIYFDSFGNLPPPKELIKYFGRNVKIKYNYDQQQQYNTFKCGHLCLKFLINNSVY